MTTKPKRKKKTSIRKYLEAHIKQNTLRIKEDAKRIEPLLKELEDRVSSMRREIEQARKTGHCRFEQFDYLGASELNNWLNYLRRLDASRYVATSSLMVLDGRI